MYLKLLELVFSSIIVKFNISVVSKATILIFLVNLPMVNIYKFHKKEFFIQPPENWELREQHLGDVWQKEIYSNHQENLEDNI